MLFKKIGARVKELREQKGLTLEQLAQLVKIDTSTLWRYESGDIRNPSLTVLTGLCDAFGVPITAFFEEISRPSGSPPPSGRTKSFDPDEVSRRIAMLSPDSRGALLEYLAFLESKTSPSPRRKSRISKLTENEE